MVSLGWMPLPSWNFSLFFPCPLKPHGNHSSVQGFLQFMFVKEREVGKKKGMWQFCVCVCECSCPACSFLTTRSEPEGGHVICQWFKESQRKRSCRKADLSRVIYVIFCVKRSLLTAQCLLQLIALLFSIVMRWCESHDTWNVAVILVSQFDFYQTSLKTALIIRFSNFRLYLNAPRSRGGPSDFRGGHPRANTLDTPLANS